MSAEISNSRKQPAMTKRKSRSSASKRGSETHADDESVGYKRPPKKHQWKKGQSGNPSGARKTPTIPPGNALALLGNHICEAMGDALATPLAELTPRPSDPAAIALSKMVVTDAIRRDGHSRKFIIKMFVESQQGADRYKVIDDGVTGARQIQDFINLILDPNSDESDLEKLGKTVERDQTDLLKNGPFDELTDIATIRKTQRRTRRHPRTEPKK